MQPTSVRGGMDQKIVDLIVMPSQSYFTGLLCRASARPRPRTAFPIPPMLPSHELGARFYWFGYSEGSTRASNVGAHLTIPKTFLMSLKRSIQMNPRCAAN